MITSYLDKQCIFLTLISVAGKAALQLRKKKELGGEKKCGFNKRHRVP